MIVTLVGSIGRACGTGTLMAFLAGLVVPGHSAAADVTHDLELPVDAEVVVLELAYQDGGGPAPETAVSVYADGAVVVPDTDGGEELRGVMTPAQLTALIAEIVEGASVFDLDSDRIVRDVREASARSGTPWRVSNPGQMLVRIRLRDREHEVRCPAAEIWHERFPEVASVGRMCAVRRRLENVRAIVQVGGWDRARELSKLANEELLRAHPEATPVTVEDLSMVRGRLPDPRFVQFVSPAATPGSETLLISVLEFPDQPPLVTIAPLAGT